MKQVIGVLLVGSLALACAGCFSFGMSVGVSDPPAPPPTPEENAPPPVDNAPPPPTDGVCEVGQLAECSGRCNAGDAPSCNNLGAMYELGSGVAFDLGRAVEMYERACAGGADGGCQNAKRLRDAPRAEPAARPAEVRPDAGWGI